LQICFRTDSLKIIDAGIAKNANRHDN